MIRVAAAALCVLVGLYWLGQSGAGTPTGGGGFRLLQGTCAGAAWVGPDTSATGLIALSNNVTLSGPAPVFTAYGTASTSSVVTVSHSGGTSVTVTVQPSGQVTIP